MSEQLTAQYSLDGEQRPLYATESERNGFRPRQLPLGIGNGERSIEDLPLFSKLYERTYTLALGGKAEHPYWWYERGYYLSCPCVPCTTLRTAKRDSAHD